MDPHWYRTFFDPLTVDFWVAAATPEWTQRDVDFAWRQLELTPGLRVLDCPCGHGRHAVELARRGCQVTAFDIAPYCLQVGRRAASEAGTAVDFRQADMLELSEPPAYDAAITLGNAFSYFDHAGLSRFIRNVAAALKPGGRWLIDTGAAAESLLPTLKPELDYELGGIRTHIRNRYVVEESCLESTFEYTRDGQTELRIAYHFIFTVAEIHRMLTAAGLTVTALYGGTSAELYTVGSHWLILQARKR